MQFRQTLNHDGYLLAESLSYFFHRERRVLDGIVQERRDQGFRIGIEARQILRDGNGMRKKGQPRCAHLSSMLLLAQEKRLFQFLLIRRGEMPDMLGKVSPRHHKVHYSQFLAIRKANLSITIKNSTTRIIFDFHAYFQVYFSIGSCRSG